MGTKVSHLPFPHLEPECPRHHLCPSGRHTAHDTWFAFPSEVQERMPEGWGQVKGVRRNPGFPRGLGQHGPAPIRLGELASGCCEVPENECLTPRSLWSRKGLHVSLSGFTCPGPSSTCPAQITVGRSHLHTHPCMRLETRGAQLERAELTEEGSRMVTGIIVPTPTREEERRDFLRLKPRRVLEGTPAPNGF